MKTLFLSLILAAGLMAQSVVNGDRTHLGRVDSSGATSTAPIKSGTSLPATCVSGKDVFFKTDATAGQNLYFCTATDTWTQQLNSGGGGGGTVYGSAANLGYFSVFPFTGNASSSAGTQTANVVRYIMFTIPAQGVFGAAQVTINAAATNNCGGGSDPCGFALAIIDPATGQPVTNALANVAAPTSTGTVALSFAGTVTLPAGAYYIAYVTNSSSLTIGGVASSGPYGGAWVNFGLASSTYRWFDGATAASFSGTTVTWPASIGTRSNVSPTYIPTIILTR